MAAVVPISGSNGHYWVHVGHNIDGNEPFMRSDWVPCNKFGQPVAITRLQNQYWIFHLPGSHKTVYFHRQIMIDVSRDGAALAGDVEIHHKNGDINDNKIVNLSVIGKRAHRILIGAARSMR